MDVVGGCDLPVDVLGRAPNSEENVVGLANSTVLRVGVGRSTQSLRRLVRTKR